MKVIIAFVAILGLSASADDLSDLKTFLSCLDKAITDGIPSVSIPRHDPLQIQDFSVSREKSSFVINTSLTNNTLYGLLNYTFPVLDVAETSSNPNTVVYDYSIYWPKLNFTGFWEVVVNYTHYNTDTSSGTYDIVLENLTWSGIFNLTKPGQEGYNETVNAFTLSSIVENVDVEIHGFERGTEFIEVLIETSLTFFLNNFPASVADLLRTSRFNEFWMGHPEKIQAIMEHCGLSK